MLIAPALMDKPLYDPVKSFRHLSYVGDVPTVLAVHPSYLKAGEIAELRIVGSGLTGDVALPQGGKLLDTVKRSASEVVVRVQADAAARGVHPVTVGKASPRRNGLYRRAQASRRSNCARWSA